MAQAVQTPRLRAPARSLAGVNVSRSSTRNTKRNSIKANAGTQPPGLKPFTLERYFAKWEFAAPYILCASDCEPLYMDKLLDMADADTLSRWKTLRLGYTETQGLPVLRAEIAKMYKTVNQDEVVVCAPEEGIYLAMQALLKPGDHVVVQYPGYQSLYEVAQSLGCVVDLWEPRLGPGGSFKYDIEDFTDILSPKTVLAVVNFPHNPSGFVPSPAEWSELVQATADVGAWLFSDEMYRRLELPPTQTLPAAADLYSRAICLGGVSKAWGLPGLRIGWLACHDDELLDKVMALKDYTTICNNAPSEILALGAIRARNRILRDNVALLQRNKDTLNDFFARWSDVMEWQPPMGGSVAFPRLRTGQPIEAWTDRVVTSSGVLLLPATVYDHPASTRKGHFRIGLGRKNLVKCLQQFDRYLQEEHGARGPGAVSLPPVTSSMDSLGPSPPPPPTSSSSNGNSKSVAQMA